MEKGNLRNTPSSSKTNNSESKSKQDGKYRFPRWKESISPRPDSRRKPNPQKNRSANDKRPRTRSNVIYEKYRNEVGMECPGASHYSKQGSKKINLNHLLNFSVAPSEGSRDYNRKPVRNKIRLPKYNKELFLQANCQFVIRDDGNYAPYFVNADLLVDWSLIEEVRLLSHEVPSCPICLHPPYAAKITRCGHIYCWACILHYLSLTDKTWQKCPICFEAIHLHDLKSVVSVTQDFISSGSRIKMCLMKREKSTLFPLQATEHRILTSACRVDDDETITRYQKLLLASKADVQSIIAREQSQLEIQCAIEEEAELCFVESALKLLEERRDLLEQKNEDCNGKSIETDVCSTSPGVENLKMHDLKIEEKILEISHDLGNSYKNSPKSEDSPYSDTGIKMKENISENISASLSLDDIHIADNVRKDKETGSFFYFYQAEDGQHIYLHGLNVRMLVTEYGSLEESPPLIEAKVLALEKISMNEEIRNRLKYLQHIPLTCEFQVAELDINHILSNSTVQEFAMEVAKRQKMRSKKAREERKREKFIEIEEKKKMGMYPSPTYNLNSCDQFPVCISSQEKGNATSPFNSSPLVATENITGCEGNNNKDVEFPVFAPFGSSPTESQNLPPVTSFAKMLQDANNSSQPWRVLKRSETVPLPKACKIDDDDQEDAMVPEFRESFSNAMQIALENALMSKEEHIGAETTSKKKKKSKNKLLFSTSMCRSK